MARSTNERYAKIKSETDIVARDRSYGTKAQKQRPGDELIGAVVRSTTIKTPRWLFNESRNVWKLLGAAFVAATFSKWVMHAEKQLRFRHCGRTTQRRQSRRASPAQRKQSGEHSPSHFSHFAQNRRRPNAAVGPWRSYYHETSSRIARRTGVISPRTRHRQRPKRSSNSKSAVSDRTSDYGLPT